jgi:peptidoglycan hydrolase CwlO-like protein
MKRSKTFFVKRLCFVVIFFLLGAFNLYAEDTSGASVPNSEREQSVSGKEYDDKINTMESNLFRLEESIKEIESSQDRLSPGASKLQIWQIISAVSAALIALLLLGLVVLLLLNQLRFHAVVEDAPKSKSCEKSREEHLSPEKPANVSLGISSIDEFNVFRNKFDDVQLQLRQLTDKVNSQSKDALRFQSDLGILQTEMADFKQKIKSTNDTVSLLKTDVDKNREKYARKEQVENDPVAIFNQWAQNPHLSFPQYFTYIANVKLEFRTKQDFTDTNTETEWIRNTVGERKYLFPNPNKIDNLSGPIDKLYKVAGMRKAKGKNSVKITSACQIKEGNFIEYQGELLLI